MALPVIEEELPSLDRSQWSALVSELPLFPPDSHPPPTLFPLLSPLLQQKLGLLSLGRGRGWPGTLTWLPADLSYKVNERLRNSLRLDGLEEQFRGYRRFDQETVPRQPYRIQLMYLDPGECSAPKTKPRIVVLLDLTSANRRPTGRLEVTRYPFARG